MNLPKWQSQPKHAKDLSVFLESPTGKRFLELLRFQFRATPLALKIEPGVDYMQINAFLNRDREAWTQLIDFIEFLSIPLKSKERIPDEGWGAVALRHEEEKELPTTAKPKR